MAMSDVRIDPVQAAISATKALQGKWNGRFGMCRCPAHQDRRPSLMVSPGRSVVLYHCFAGCTQDAIMAGLKATKMDGARPTIENQVPPRSVDYRSLALRLLRESQPAPRSLAGRYLTRRHIDIAAEFARYHPRVRTYDGARKVSLPALILPLYGASGFTAVHRTFLAGDGSKAAIEDPKKMLGFPLDGAVRFGPVEDVLNLAEGFEDAVSALILNNLTNCWAACGIERYAEIFIPDSVQRIIIWSQHGPEPISAIERARSHLIANGRKLSVELPPPGGDWNDALCSMRDAM